MARLIVTHPRFKDLTGKKFGRLAALYPVKKQNGKYVWECQCDCGSRCQVMGTNLSHGVTRSCGCLLREFARGNVINAQKGRTTHGRCGTYEYQAWQSMKTRCYTDRPEYANHFGRGIRVCDRWLHSFENFFADVGARPSDRHVLDRIDSDKNYEPGNVRWADPNQQARNRRNNRLLEYRGESRPLSEWAEMFGMSCWTLNTRLRKGLSVAEALETPIDKRFRHHGQRKKRHN